MPRKSRQRDGSQSSKTDSSPSIYSNNYNETKLSASVLKSRGEVPLREKIDLLVFGAQDGHSNVKETEIRERYASRKPSRHRRYRENKYCSSSEEISSNENERQLRKCSTNSDSLSSGELRYRKIEKGHRRRVRERRHRNYSTDLSKSSHSRQKIHSNRNLYLCSDEEISSTSSKERSHLKSRYSHSSKNRHLDMTMKSIPGRSSRHDVSSREARTGREHSRRNNIRDDNHCSSSRMLEKRNDDHLYRKRYDHRHGSREGGVILRRREKDSYWDDSDAYEHCFNREGSSCCSHQAYGHKREYYRHRHPNGGRDSRSRRNNDSSHYPDYPVRLSNHRSSQVYRQCSTISDESKERASIRHVEELHGRRSQLKGRYPQIQFSVNHKLHKGNNYQIYLCGNIPELGGAANPLMVRERGIPLEESVENCANHYETPDFIDVKSKQPGDEVHYLYYIMYMDRKVIDIERFATSRDGATMVRKFIVPEVKAPYSPDQRRWIKSDERYGKLSGKTLSLACNMHVTDSDRDF